MRGRGSFCNAYGSSLRSELHAERDQQFWHQFLARPYISHRMFPVRENMLRKEQGGSKLFFQ